MPILPGSKAGLARFDQTGAESTRRSADAHQSNSLPALQAESAVPGRCAVEAEGMTKECAALSRLADALADDILNAPDEEILAEFMETHGDPDHNAAEMRALFERAVKFSR
jgi:hypothetical protein